MLKRPYAQQGGAGHLLLLILVFMFGVNACQSPKTNLPFKATEQNTDTETPCPPQETILPFETIEQKLKADMGPPYEGREPGLMVIARPEKVANLDDWVTKDAKTQLQTLDYGAYFALIVFQGWKGTNGYSIQIERITRQEKKVTVFVWLQEPQPDMKKNDTVTSPYHLVQVQKMDTWARNVTFNMVADGAIIVSVSHNVP